MPAYFVSCREMNTSDERIIAVGCVREDTGSKQRFTEREAIHRIEAKTDTFRVKDSEGHIASVHVEERDGDKFLITKRDGVTTDNLGALPKCSAAPRHVTSSGSHSVSLRRLVR